MVCLASLATLGGCAARATVKTWARGPTGWDAKMIRWQAGNKAAVDAFNAHGGVYDFVQVRGWSGVPWEWATCLLYFPFPPPLNPAPPPPCPPPPCTPPPPHCVQYGDSLTRFLQSQGKEDGWATIFSGMQAAAYGVPGHGIEDLTWRLMKGGELPAKPPRVLALLVGCVSRAFSLRSALCMAVLCCAVHAPDPPPSCTSITTTTVAALFLAAASTTCCPKSSWAGTP